MFQVSILARKREEGIELEKIFECWHISNSNLKKFFNLNMRGLPYNPELFQESVQKYREFVYDTLEEEDECEFIHLDDLDDFISDYADTGYNLSFHIEIEN